jgi:hypothetical protein
MGGPSNYAMTTTSDNSAYRKFAPFVRRIHESRYPAAPCCCLRAAQRCFIISDSRFRPAALIPTRRPFLFVPVFVGTAATRVAAARAPAFPRRAAHHFRFAPPMRFRAAALMRRPRIPARPRPWLPVKPSRAAMALSMRSRSARRSATICSIFIGANPSSSAMRRAMSNSTTCSPTADPDRPCVGTSL